MWRQPHCQWYHVTSLAYTTTWLSPRGWLPEVEEHREGDGEADDGIGNAHLTSLTNMDYVTLLAYTTTWLLPEVEEYREGDDEADDGGGESHVVDESGDEVVDVLLEQTTRPTLATSTAN